MSMIASSVVSPLSSLPIPHCAGTLCDVAWAPSGTHLAAVTSAGWTFLWDSQTGAILQQKQVTRTALLSVTWAREGTCLAVGGQDGIVRLLDAQLRVRSAYPFDAPIKRVAWAPHIVGACVIVTGQHVTMLREDTRTTRILSYRSTVLDAVWSGDGRHIALLCADGLVEVWHARQWRLVRRFATEPLADGSLCWDQPCHTLLIRDALGAVCAYPLREAPGRSSSFVPRYAWPETAEPERGIQDPSGRYLATLYPREVVLSALVASGVHALR